MVHRLPVPSRAQEPADPAAPALRRVHRRCSPAARVAPRPRRAARARGADALTQPAAAPAIATLLLAAALAACDGSGAHPTATLQAPDSADQMLVGFSHFLTSDGIRRSQVDADTAFFFENTQLTSLRPLKAVFFDHNGPESST